MGAELHRRVQHSCPPRLPADRSHPGPQGRRGEGLGSPAGIVLQGIELVIFVFRLSLELGDEVASGGLHRRRVELLLGRLPAFAREVGHLATLLLGDPAPHELTELGGPQPT